MKLDRKRIYQKKESGKTSINTRGKIVVGKGFSEARYKPGLRGSVGDGTRSLKYCKSLVTAEGNLSLIDEGGNQNE